MIVNKNQAILINKYPAISPTINNIKTTTCNVLFLLTPILFLF